MSWVNADREAFSYPTEEELREEHERDLYECHYGFGQCLDVRLRDHSSCLGCGLLREQAAGENAEWDEHREIEKEIIGDERA